MRKNVAKARQRHAERVAARAQEPTINTTSILRAQPPATTQTPGPATPTPTTIRPSDTENYPSVMKLIESDVEAIAGQLPWLAGITGQQIKKLKMLFDHQIKHQKAVQDIEHHLKQKTAPKYLNIRINAQVSKTHQEKVKSTVAAAIWTCQETILNAMLDARRAELTEITEDIDATKKAWTTRKDEYVTLMHDADVPIPATKIALAEADFETKIKQTLYQVRSNAVLRAKKIEEKAEARKAREAERNIDQLLGTKTAELQSRLKTLESKVTGLQKNAHAKPSQGRPKGSDGGGKGTRPKSPERSKKKNGKELARSSSKKSDKPTKPTKPKGARAGRDKKDDAKKKRLNKKRDESRGPGRGRGAQKQ